MGCRSTLSSRAARGARFALCVLALAAAACGDDPAPQLFEPPEPVVPEVGRAELAPDTVRLLPGQDRQLVLALYGVTGAPVANVPAEWAVADAAVASVGVAGLVQAVAPGLTTVTATAGGKEARTVVGVGMTGSYVLRLADGEPVPGTLQRRPDCPATTFPEPGPNPTEYRVERGTIEFVPGSAERVVADLRIVESCPYSESIFFGGGDAPALYEVADGVVRWREGAGSMQRLPLGDARIKGDSLILAWKPAYSDSIRLHFVRQ